MTSVSHILRPRCPVSHILRFDRCQTVADPVQIASIVVQIRDRPSRILRTVHQLVNSLLNLLVLLMLDVLPLLNLGNLTEHNVDRLQ